MKQKGITKRTAVGECIEATPLNSIEKSKINPTLMRLSEFCGVGLFDSGLASDISNS
jgi:hypothetical protein